MGCSETASPFRTRCRIQPGVPMTWRENQPFENLLVLCAANNYDGIKLADQHLAEHLSKLIPVLYVDPPLSPLTGLRNPDLVRSLTGPRIRMLAPGLARLTPVVQPFPTRKGMAGLTTALTRSYVRRAASRLGREIQAVLSAWPQYPIFGSCGERVSVYWAQDDFVGGAELMGLNTHQVELRERRIAADASFVIAANPLVAETWRSRGRDSVLIPFGVDLEAYNTVDRAPAPADVHLPGPIVGVIGQINHRTDLRLLEAIVERGRSLLLVGPRDPAFEPQRFDALLRRDNVSWVGPKPFGSLPGYLRMIDVGLVPYVDSAFNRGSFPLKTLEYLASGRGVVATDLPAIRWLGTDMIAVASEPGPFADLVDRLLGEGRSGAIMARRRAFAAQHSWANCAASIYDAICGCKVAPTGSGRA